jgi:hypothetical protein
VAGSRRSPRRTSRRSHPLTRRMPPTQRNQSSRLTSFQSHVK